MYGNRVNQDLGSALPCPFTAILSDSLMDKSQIGVVRDDNWAIVAWIDPHFLQAIIPRGKEDSAKDLSLHSIAFHRFGRDSSVFAVWVTNAILDRNVDTADVGNVLQWILIKHYEVC